MKIKIDTLVPVTFTVDQPDDWNDWSTEEKLFWAQDYLSDEARVDELTRLAEEQLDDCELGPDSISNSLGTVQYSSTARDAYIEGMPKHRPGLEDEQGYWWSGSIGGTRQMIGEQLREIASRLEEDVDLKTYINTEPPIGPTCGWFLART